MFKRVLYLCLVTSATLMLLACGGKKDEDALMEEEGSSKPAASASTAAAPAAAAPATGAGTVTGKVNFEGIEVRVDPSRVRPVDQPLLVADASKLRAATGWAPLFSIEATLADMLDDWRRALRSEARP